MTTRISVSQLGKRYRLGTDKSRRGSYRRISDDLLAFARNPFKFFTDRPNLASQSDFWALSDVGFDIKDGEVVGVIGRNGAGKSTLLKLLSRITEPTRGSIALDGRVASLLEVGTGFHPELTGRENVFLNGAILGMSRHEVRRKFDEIVEFAEVERFLDTPVKRYSSGMYVRLAFAVAAHLEPEILVVDEVLAVGDAEFQKKCLGKMESVAEGGRTVLFVSHQMGAVSNLCTRCLYLKAGKLIADGPTNEIIQQYLADGEGDTTIVDRTQEEAGNKPAVWFTDLRTQNGDGRDTSSFAHDEPVSIVARFATAKRGELPRGLSCSICLQDGLNRRVFTDYLVIDDLDSSSGRVNMTITLPANLVAPGKYTFILTLHTFQCEVFDRLDRVCAVSIVDNGTKLSMFQPGETGCMLVSCDWKTRGSENGFGTHHLTSIEPQQVQ